MCFLCVGVGGDGGGGFWAERRRRSVRSFFNYGVVVYVGGCGGDDVCSFFIVYSTYVH